MAEPDGAPVGKYQVSKYIPSPDDVERITIPPSTELIPDEYEHDDNKKGLVLIFSSNEDEQNKRVLIKAFEDQCYEVNNIFPVTTKESVLSELKEISTQDHTNKTCLILIFMANCETKDQFLPDEDHFKRFITVKEVWSHFTANNCPSFKHKPKIFIFQASKKKVDTVERDGVMLKPPQGAYDIPAEADLLIVYKRIPAAINRNDFMVQLCNNLDAHGVKDDIINLVTHTTHEDESIPIIISTLTRKFYVSPSSKRGHHFDFDMNHYKVMDLLEQMQGIHRSKLEHKFVKKWQEIASTSGVSTPDTSSSKTDDSPKPTKLESSQSKRISRTTSGASSVDSKKKAKITKKKLTWKY